MSTDKIFLVYFRSRSYDADCSIWRVLRAFASEKSAANWAAELTSIVEKYHDDWKVMVDELDRRGHSRELHGDEHPDYSVEEMPVTA